MQRLSLRARRAWQSHFLKIVRLNPPIPKFKIPQFLCFVLLRKDSRLQR